MPTVLDSLNATLLSNAALISDYSALLVTESANPQPSTNIDGFGVSWNERRQGLIDAITKLTQSNILIQKTINQLSPYIVTTKLSL